MFGYISMRERDVIIESRPNNDMNLGYPAYRNPSGDLSLLIATISSGKSFRLHKKKMVKKFIVD
jgi:hypothetical protein